MPYLPITDGAGNLLQNAPNILLSIMVHPDNEQHRREYLSVYTISDLLQETEEKNLEVSRETLENLLSAPSPPKILSRVAESFTAGRLAGDLLTSVAKFAYLRPQHASLLKAIWIEQKGEGSAGKSRAKIFECWRRFGPVAHLWAALRAAQDDATKWPCPSCDPLIVESIPTFLAGAEQFRRIGESVVPKRGLKKPSLDPATTWKAPVDLALPPEIVLVSPPVTAEQERLLASYQPPKSA